MQQTFALETRGALAVGVGLWLTVQARILLAQLEHAVSLGALAAREARDQVERGVGLEEAAALQAVQQARLHARAQARQPRVLLVQHFAARRKLHQLLHLLFHALEQSLARRSLCAQRERWHIC